MTHEFRLADIGEGLEEAEIIAWRVQVGDRVHRDQTIVEVMTDKSNAELPAPIDGVVVALGGEIGDMVEVGSVLAVIEPAAQAPSASASVAGQDAPPSAEASDETVSQDVAATTAPGTGSTSSAPAEPNVSTFQVAAASAPRLESDRDDRPTRPKASPTTRVEAARRGIDLRAVVGTGPGGRILLTDLDPLDPPTETTPRPSPNAGPPAAVAEPEPGPSAAELPAPEAHASATAPPPAPIPAASIPAATAEPARVSRSDDTDLAENTVEPLRGIRRAIARNMHQSWSTIPHIHSVQQIDAEPLIELRDQLRSSGRPEFESLTPLSFFVAAVANAIALHPIANASLDLDAETITHRSEINVGIAVAAPQGLVVPVIDGAGSRSFASIASAVRSTVDGARTGSLPAESFRNGTVTITNFGSLGGEQALPLIRPPESAIFGFGSIANRPFVVNDEVVARKTMHIVIGTDHRLLDGDVTTALVSHVASLLENPINLVLAD